MDLIAIVPKGLESVAHAEVHELIGDFTSSFTSHSSFPSPPMPGWIAGTISCIEDGLRAAYRGQSVLKILIGCPPIKIEGGNWEKAIQCAAQSLSEINLVHKDGLAQKERVRTWGGTVSFSARAFKIENDQAPSCEIAAFLGARIKEHTSFRVDLKNPDIIISAVVCPDHVLLGVDLARDDLGKRPYRLFQHGQALKAPLGYALVQTSRWQGRSRKDLLLDPFCQAGTVAIEAALWASHTSPRRFSKEGIGMLKEGTNPFFPAISARAQSLHARSLSSILAMIDAEILDPPGSIVGFDQSFPAISASKKNAKLAGVEKWIRFGKADLDWVNLKLAAGSVDAIATVPPMPSRFASLEKLKPLYSRFLDQASEVLARNGNIALLAKSADDWVPVIEKHQSWRALFYPVYQGKEPFVIVHLKRAP